jgi:hypothetical protein
LKDVSEDGVLLQGITFHEIGKLSDGIYSASSYPDATNLACGASEALFLSLRHAVSNKHVAKRAEAKAWPILIKATV